jgi:intracellular sulfur oxidation DsrE/DsrF family protein
VCLLFAAQSGLTASDPVADSDEEFPEVQEINRILKAGQPGGVVFLVMDYDVEAYLWVLPRLEHYVRMMREEWPEVPLVILSHGDEIISLLEKNETEYRSFHEKIRHLILTYNVDFQVCGAYAALSGIDESEFADFVDVVPSAPSQIKDYRQMDYKIVSLEQIW